MAQLLAHNLGIVPSLQCVDRIGVPKLVEAENRALLVGAENRICYNADRLWLCRGLFLHGREDYSWHEKAVSIKL